MTRTNNSDKGRSAASSTRHSKNHTLMTSRFSRLALALTGIAIIIAVSLPTTLHAQSEETEPRPGIKGVDISVKAGFGGLAVNNYFGGWVPFRVSLANDAEPVSGKLIIRSDYPGSQQGREFSTEVQLPSGSRQYYELPVFLNSSQKDPSVSLVAKDGSVVAATSVKIERQNFGWNDRLDIAVVDSDSSALSVITSAQLGRPANREPFKASPGSDQTTREQDTIIEPAGPPMRGRNRGFGQQQPAGAQPVVIQAEDLPRDSVSYDSVNAIVLGDRPLGQLTADQARALRLWVAGGGLLIITGATDVAGLRSAGLDDMSPVDFKGNSTVGSLSELNAAYGKFDTSDALLIMSSRLRSGASLLLGSAEQPLAAERAYGSGLVRFVAINPKLNPYRSWSGSKPLWNDLLLPAAEASSRRTPQWMASRRSGRGGLQDSLFKLAGIEPLSATYFIFFLLFYIVIVGPLNYIALRFLKKLDLAWLTIPAVVIVFTAAGVTFAQFSRGWDSTEAESSVVELYQPEGIERASGALLFSPNSKGTHEISFPGHDTLVCDSSNQSSDPYELERASASFLLRVEMNKWTHGLMNTRTANEGVKPLVSVDGIGGSTLSVKNLSEAALSKAVVLTPAGISDVFDLAPGESKQVAVARPSPTTFSNWYGPKLGSDEAESKIFGDVEERFDAAAEVSGFAPASGTAQVPGMQKRPNRPILVGFSDASSMNAEFRSSVRRKSKTLYLIHL